MQNTITHMIEKENAIKVIDVLTKNLEGVANNHANFQKLPDSFWGYYARGHDNKGKFGVIVTYSEDENDVDDLMKMYETWLAKNKAEQKESE